MNADSRGVLRGRCTACSCDAYVRASGGVKCDDCGHPPAKHENLSATVEPDVGPQPVKSRPTLTPPLRPSARPVSAAYTRPIPAPRKARKASAKSLSSFTTEPRCLFPNCTDEAFFDPNSGDESPYCSNHLDTEHSLPAALSSMCVTDGRTDFAKSMPLHGTVQGLPQATLWQSIQSPFLTLPSVVQPFQPPPPTVAQPQQRQQPQPPVLLPNHLRCKYPECNRQRYQDGSRAHEFCGKRHAVEYSRLTQKGIPPSADMKCKTPQCPLRRRARDDGEGYYDYCSLSCRDMGSQMTHSSSQPNLAHGETCSLPGCIKPKYVDPANGREHDFCGRTHARQAQMSGITVNSCRFTLLSTGTREFIQVQALFQNTWAQAKGVCPAITYVFLITNRQLEARWKRYQKTLPVVTVEQYYHGTKLKCDIVNQGTPCNLSKCGICGISQTGMDRRYIRENINFQRFGHGFYFAPNSSKCHDYTQGVHTHRAMLQCDILPGNKYPLTRGDQKLTGPPPGYHSVHGQTGGDLNYEELVVYNPDCVMPRYVIVYQRDKVHKIAK